MTGNKADVPFHVAEIDECLQENTCDHVCVNTVGSYTCSCHPGYTLIDGHTCKGMFIERCVNTVGSHTCSCHPGYTLIDGYSCKGMFI